MNSRLKADLLELLSPLSLAAYAAWGAVWLTLDPLMARDPQLGWLARGGALVFLLGFMLEHFIGRRLSAAGFAIFCALLAGAALLPIALTPHGAAPILLVLLAALLAARFEGWRLWIALLLVNLALAAVVFSQWPGRGLGITLAAYVSFQLFAALVMQYAKRAESMSEQLRAVNADLVATRSLLEASARDAERLRLSRELHDVAGHALTALKLNLGALARDPRQPDPQRVALCAGLADDLLQNLRGVVKQMRAHEGIDLRSAIERLAAPFPKPAIHLDIDADARVHDIERADALLRTVQEGLTNAARHAGANQLWLSLRRDGERVALEIRDDGRAAEPLRPGNGLRGMRERLQALGGEVTFGRAEGGGLRLLATLPMAAA
jgi:signal transduction histidine kinase